MVADPEAKELIELAVVERHWSIESIMVEVETALEVPDLFGGESSAELSYQGVVLHADNALPDYPAIENGAVLRCAVTGSVTAVLWQPFGLV